MASDSLQNTDEIEKSLRSLLNISQPSSSSSSDNIQLPNLHSSIPAPTMQPPYHHFYPQNHGRRPHYQNWFSANNSYFYAQGQPGYLPMINNNAPFYPCPSFPPYGFPPPPRSVGNFFGQVSMPPPPPLLLPSFQSWCPPVQDFNNQNLILNQINYYFSDENLVKDIYLRQQMDSNGWVPVTLIAGFKRIAQLTDDIELIIFVLQRSSVVEVRDYKIRKRNNWLKWVLPCSSAQHLENSSVNIPTN